MLNKRYLVYVNNVLMTRALTSIKAKRLVAEYLAKGLKASWAEEII